ncbi:conserved membrane protein of unknown function [Tepidanaerobacter acetatoxydans Re1]|uniref:DUF8173 domain-containing protein n=1 Tax=Tepidanaerobacter acetatoxydans (strain DSM 21804 / JCM 16047 / Re1) TaxID=1209989 RepID=F4LTZ9_TEPAE|nr:polymer-forming cytoskeletal protein [Tepidanaerobacter acetatoxydans]AEE90525.1 hypothetical protein TepRe1_0322 [Tepidanaerobacter acetatoxydans Re1]CCP25036.1 conserved membrane protein of unknown function [Tepidanaerobacter acetatoxydans Re1]
MKKILILIFTLLLLIPTPVLATETDDLIQIHKDITIDSNEVVTSDIIAIMGDIRVDGKVTGDVVAILGDIRVNGEVTGDVTAVGGRVIRGETSKIYGKTTEVKISGVKNIVNDITRQGTNRRYIWFKIVRFLGLLAVGILVIILFPNSIKMASGAVEKEVGRKMLIGLAILLLTPVMLLLLFITLIGIPLIPILLLLLYAAGFFGYLCISIFIGRKLNEHLKMKSEILLEFALGALLLWLINLVPFIGGLTSAIVLITSLGITAETRFGTKRSTE